MTRSPSATLTFAYTPDPDDAFHYCALETGRVSLPAGWSLAFAHEHIKDLNASCREDRYEVCAISSVFFPTIDERYVILASGASVGRGYGPVLACRAGTDIGDLRGRRIAVPGISTTGAFLLDYFYAGYMPVPMAFDEVEDAILSGRVDAGVLIHEELLNYRERPLQKICCLGARWAEHTGLPLPVGLIVARRSLGLPTIRQVENLLYASMAWALANREEAMDFASRFGRGPTSRVREDFVRKFANGDTLSMPADVRLGLGTLYAKALARGYIGHLPALDVVDPDDARPVAA
ncbi:MAG TPA: hypothetical protein PJ986_01710 [Gammaproteobacteria bacterium]|nr:hypothetical protein [Gammaproteobacteria bacterium]